MCAKLSTCGSIPTAKLITMMTTSVNNAAAYESKLIHEIYVTQMSAQDFEERMHTLLE